MVDALKEEREEAAALLLLGELPGVGEASVRRLVEKLGSGRDALEVAAPVFADVAGEEAAALRREPERRARAERVVTWCAGAGVRPLPLGAAEYPASLLDLRAPPSVLFLRGDAALLSLPGAAVVGSRAATAYGRRSAERIAHVLARNGVVVVSGLALGVDGAAHRAALEAGGPTVAVMGNGPDRVHPAAHRGLARRIAADGLLATELPPGAEALAHHFPKRNRILAALAKVVVVVEAARRSGALITARLAGELHREVLAVPGPMDAATSQGSNWLLAEGIPAVADPRVVLDAVLGLDAARAPAAWAPPPPQALGAAAEAAWSCLDAAPRELEEVARRAGLPSGRAQAALATLEMEGWVVRTPGPRFARSDAPGAA